MRVSPARFIPALPAGALAALLPAPAMAAAPYPLGDLLPTVIAYLGIAIAGGLILVFALYAYAALARFAPYHSWIYLYLVSLVGITWAAFLATTGGSLTTVVFLVTSVIGLNLIVHVLRFDQVNLLSPKRQEQPGPLMFEI